MKTCTLLLALLGYSISIIAQEKAPLTRDFGISVSQISLQNMPLNLTYKRGHDQKFWRFEATALNMDLNAPGQVTSGTSSTSASRLNFGLRMAREKRKEVTDRLLFYRGIEFGVVINGHTRDLITDLGDSQIERQLTVMPTLGYSIGGILTLSENLYLSAELSPHVCYGYTKSHVERTRDFPAFESITTVENHETGVRISQGAMNLGFFYTFTK